MKPFSAHSNFFSSLKQVEMRLKSEDPSQSSSTLFKSSPPQPHQPPPTQPPSPQLPESNFTTTESLSSPIYLNTDQTNNSSTFQESEPPQAFLLSSQQFQPTPQDPSQINGLDEVQDNTADDIQRLIQLLGLSDYREEEEEEQQQKGGLCLKSGNDGNSCNCDGGFYKKIVGMKGPKCVKEVERLKGWIKHFANDNGDCNERIEPLRLAHLLLGKAAFVGGFSGLEFPSTIEEFLENDPPKGYLSHNADQRHGRCIVIHRF